MTVKIYNRQKLFLELCHKLKQTTNLILHIIESYANSRKFGKILSNKEQNLLNDRSTIIYKINCINQMKNGLNNLLLRGKQKEAQSIRRSVASSSIKNSENSKVDDKRQVLDFSYPQYPFVNALNYSLKLLRTTIDLQITTDNLQKLIKLNHPNIINLQKIVKNNYKNSNLKNQPETFYSFYYQVVPYSLKKVVIKQNSSLLQQVIKNNFKKVIATTVAYLIECNICYGVKIEDIGVNSHGQIKIYIPPHVIFQANKEQNQTNIIYKSLEKIINWWDQNVTSKFSQENKTYQIMLPPTLSTNFEAEIQEDIENELQKQFNMVFDHQQNSGIRNSRLNAEIKKTKSILHSQLSKKQFNQIQKINEKIQKIRQKLNQKKNGITRQLQGEEQKCNQYDMRKKDCARFADQVNKDKNNLYKRQSIQQNINCINIYNSSINADALSPKNLAGFHQPLNQNQQRSYRKYGSLKKYNSYPNNLDAQFFREDEQLSQDTYDIDFEEKCQMPNIKLRNLFRQTLFPVAERELSEYSDHNYKKKSKQNSKKYNNTKLQSNKVQNKDYTQSAGPLQFKNFVNKFIKPQFLAKKSNIYQDPDEYQSEKSVEIKKQRLCQNLDARISLASQSVSAEKSGKDYRKYVNKMKIQNILKATEKELIKQEEIKRIKSQNSLGPYFSAKRQKQKDIQECKDEKIQQRVQKALEKTKNAIAFLNRVKSCKNIEAKMFIFP